MTFIFFVGVCVGILLGYAYGWMKYHYPESVAMIQARAAKYRADAAEQEAREERARREIDDSLHERLIR